MTTPTGILADLRAAEAAAEKAWHRARANGSAAYRAACTRAWNEATAARREAEADSESVTYATAAAMLGVTKGTVSQLVARGKLDRHPEEGGVSVASIIARAAERADLSQ